MNNKDFDCVVKGVFGYNYDPGSRRVCRHVTFQDLERIGQRCFELGQRCPAVDTEGDTSVDKDPHMRVQVDLVLRDQDFEYDAELLEILEQVADKIVRQSHRVRGTVCTEPEADDAVHDSIDNVIGTITVAKGPA